MVELIAGVSLIKGDSAALILSEHLKKQTLKGQIVNQLHKKIKISQCKMDKNTYVLKILPLNT